MSPTSGVSSAQTLAGLLRSAAERWPTLPALEAERRVWRYEELDAAVDAGVGLLTAHGVVAGDRIAVLLEHGAGLLAVPFIASRMGISALLLSPTLARERWGWQLENLAPALVITDQAHAGDLDGFDVDLLTCEGGDPGLGGTRRTPGSSIPAEGHGPDAIVLYLGTSGTTGMPKLTCLTERGLLHAARGYLPRTRLVERDERSLVVMPLSYIGPITAQSLLMPLVGGCSVVADDTRPGAVADRLAVDPITHLDAVPAWLNRLAPRLTQAPAAWRGVIYGGAPMPPATAACLAERVPGLALYDVWGLSEAHGPVTVREHDPSFPSPAGVVGRAVPGLAVQAVPDGQVPGGCVQDRVGKVGELWIAGPSVTPGYLNDSEATTAALHEGWLATGDLGTVDDDGTVRLLGRRKDVILRGGANVFSLEVEQVLASAPEVVEAAVFAVPSRSAGEVPGVAVVLAGGGTQVAGLRYLVRRRIGAHAVPRHIYVVDELPRNPMGKVDKQALAHAMLSSSITRRLESGAEGN